MGGGAPVAVEGELPLWGMQIDVAAAAEEVRAVGRDDGAKPLDDFLGSVGLGAVGEQLKDLRLSAPSLVLCMCWGRHAGVCPLGEPVFARAQDLDFMPNDQGQVFMGRLRGRTRG